MQADRGDYLNSPTLPRAHPHSTSSYGSSEDSYDRLHNHSRSASGTSQTHYDEPLPSPPSRLMMDDFLNQDDEVVDDILAPKPRTRRISDILHNQDPTAMHLLLETALNDSEDFDILTPDELNALKREEQSIARRIAANKQKLFLEMRIRNTAQSLGKLDPKKRPGLSEQGLSPEEQRCNEISLEIYRLERRLAELHNRRMKHTAGILQIHHELTLHADRGLSDHSAMGSARGLRGARLSLLEADDIIDLPEDDQRFQQKLESLNRAVYNTIATSGASAETGSLPPPDPRAKAEDQLTYLEHGLQLFSTFNHAQNSSQDTDDMLFDLWHNIRSREADLKRSREHMKKTPIEGVDDFELEEEDEQEDPEQEGAFSHEAFSQQVQRLCKRAQLLSDQHLALRDQLVQERQEAQAVKDADRARLVEELQDAHDQHLNSQRAFKDAQAQLMDFKTQHSQTQQELDFTKQQLSQRDTLIAELEASDSAVNLKLNEVEEQFSILNSRLQEAEMRAVENENRALESERRTTGLETQVAEHQNRALESDRRATELETLAAASQSRAAEVENQVTHTEAQAAEFEQFKVEKAKEMEQLQAEMQNYEGEVVRLQTELTVARAELDGAYGTRAQRAAEVASNPEIMRELADLNKRNGELQKELQELVVEYESMVKQGIEAEKQRESLEGIVDGLREKMEALEVKVNENKIQTVGKVDGAAPSEQGKVASEMTSMSVLRSEFKKMVREIRNEYFTNLRAEQEERRKLESVIRTLRKEQHYSQSQAQSQSQSLPSGLMPQAAAGKSNLSKSVSAS